MLRLLSRVIARFRRRKYPHSAHQRAASDYTNTSPLVNVNLRDAYPGDVQEIRRQLGLPASPPRSTLRGVIEDAFRVAASFCVATTRPRRQKTRRFEKSDDSWDCPILYRPTLGEAIRGIVGNVKSLWRRNEAFPPPELDEYGLPRYWSWCLERSLKAFPAEPEIALDFLTDPPVSGPELIATYLAIDDRHESMPASPETTLGFLREPPLLGPELYRVWQAIGESHDAYYRHEDMNPCLALERDYDVTVSPDGVVNIPDGR